MKEKEIIRICQFHLDGEEMLDIRFWTHTKTGLEHSDNCLAIKRSQLTRFIALLQKTHTQYSSEDAKQESGLKS